MYDGIRVLWSTTRLVTFLKIWKWGFICMKRITFLIREGITRISGSLVCVLPCTFEGPMTSDLILGASCQSRGTSTFSVPFSDTILEGATATLPISARFWAFRLIPSPSTRASYCCHRLPESLLKGCVLGPMLDPLGWCSDRQVGQAPSSVGVLVEDAVVQSWEKLLHLALLRPVVFSGCNKGQSRICPFGVSQH